MTGLNYWCMQQHQIIWNLYLMVSEVCLHTTEVNNVMEIYDGPKLLMCATAPDCLSETSTWRYLKYVSIPQRYNNIVEIYNEPKLSKYTTAPDRLPETSTWEFGESVSLLRAYLRVFEESLLVVWAPPCPVRFLPGAVRQPLMPGLVQGEERGVDHTADGRLVEVLAEILKRHPEQGMKKKKM